MVKNFARYTCLLILLMNFSACLFNDSRSNLICRDQNHCFTLTQNLPFVDDGKSGIIFTYGRNLDGSESFVHLRNTDVGFYYQWKGDTLLLRCPYWKVVKDNTQGNSKFNFRRDFNEEERALYDTGTDKFYNNVRKDFTESTTSSYK
jgi:hypothetical protein